MTRRKTPPLVAAVKREIAAVPGAAKSWRAELALRLAEEITDPRRLLAGGEVPVGEPLAARVSAGKLLADTMTTLTADVPAEQPKGGLDEIRAARERRKASA